MRQETVTEYRAAGKKLIDRVDASLMANPALGSLIGGNPVEVMQQNHRHHHAFVADLLDLDAVELFDAVVPWVYRTYRAHGFAYEYFPAEFKAWEDAIKAELSFDAATELLAFYRRFPESHEKMVALAEAELPPREEAPEHLRVLVAEMTGALLAGNATRVLVLGQPMARGVDGIVSLYTDVIAPALHRIGDLWGCGEISVAHEHLASGIVNRAMSYWYVETLKCPKRGGKALFATAPGELHSIGVNMLADIFTADGWEVINLGADTPAGDIGLMAAEYRPDIVGVSVSMPFNLVSARTLIGKVRQHSPGSYVIAGGQALAFAPSVTEKIGADAYAESARQALVISRSIRPPDG